MCYGMQFQAEVCVELTEPLPCCLRHSQVWAFNTAWHALHAFSAELINTKSVLEMLVGQTTLQVILDICMTHSLLHLTLVKLHQSTSCCECGHASEQSVTTLFWAPPPITDHRLEIHWRY